MMFALALLTVRLLHVVLLIYSARRDTRRRRDFLRLLPTLLIGPGLVVLGATQETPLREVLWLCAVLVDFGGPALFGMGGLHVRPGHFVERHGSIVIIALGESIFQMAGRPPATCTGPMSWSPWCSVFLSRLRCGGRTSG
jgi:low temperature requirement protein LtrA